MTDVRTDPAAMVRPASDLWTNLLHRAKKPATAYLILWALGGINSCTALRGLDVSHGSQGESAIFLWVFIVATLLHQGFIYLDVHDMDAHPARYNDFKGWLNTNLEVGLRVAIFISVLVTAGKLHPLFEIATHANSHGNAVTVYTWRGLTVPQLSLVFGSVILFALNVVWNIFARLRRTESPIVGGRNAFSKFVDDELKVFMVLDSIALAFWIFMAIELIGYKGGLSTFTKFAIVVYLVACAFRAVVRLSKRDT
jgi:hypothetical protein